jgi:hypothetical protein
MSVFYIPGVPDHVAARTMTVFDDPVRTEARYQPGLDGVEAALIRLNIAFDAGDVNWVRSILADMAWCLGIDADSFPRHPVSFWDAVHIVPDLEEAVLAGDLEEAMNCLFDMTHFMGMHALPASIHTKPSYSSWKATMREVRNDPRQHRKPLQPSSAVRETAPQFGCY